MVLLTPRSATAVRNLTLFSTWYTSLHVCRSRHPSSCTRSSLRPLPCLGCDPSRTRIFAVFGATSLPCQFLPAVGHALLTSCRSALLSLAVGPLFPFFSVSTASAATSLTSTCLSTCSTSFHNCFARQLSVRYVSCNATLLSRALPLLHGYEPSVSTSCSLVHVLTHVFSARSFTCCAWSGGLPAPLSPSSARCACGGRCLQSSVWFVTLASPSIFGPLSPRA